MKKKLFRGVCIALSSILLLAALVVACYAEKTLVFEGYCVAPDNGAVAQTNIKWEIFEENGAQTIYFTIDESKGSKNTVLHAKNRDTGADAAPWTSNCSIVFPWGEYMVGNSKLTKAVIGEGITEINGAFIAYSSIKTVEVPKTLVKLTTYAFNRALSLDTVNVTGEEENPGVVNLKYITDIPNNIFGGENRIAKYAFNPDYTGKFGNETFSKNNFLSEIEIPAGVTALGDKIFTGTNTLAYLKILGKETVLTEKTFEGMSKYPRIVGQIGSAAESFAKANGYTFINIENDEVVHEGTKPLADPPQAGGSQGGASQDGTSQGGTSQGGDSGASQGGSSAYVPVFETFDPTGATAHGHMTGEYNGSRVVDTYWAYYGDTKTLKIVSNSKNYNETGRISFADDKMGWASYLTEIEHVIVGDYISKLSGDFCTGMTNLRSVELSPKLSQMNTEVFTRCTNLTTVYYRGQEKIEGLADFSGMKLTNSIKDTQIKVLKLSPQNQDLEKIVLPASLEKIITPYYNSEYFDSFCKENLLDLQDAGNPNNVKSYCIRVDMDPSWPKCGPRTAFEFDEATGVLTVHGIGEIDDITNYYGGGSKNQPWFSIRDNVKHIVITQYVNKIGKYAFTEFINLETVQLPNVDKIEIMNAAFEKCYNLKSIYVEGSEPVEGTFDLRLVKDELYAWTFAYNYLVANVILDESVAKIGKTTFEENLGVNLTGIYGVPGSFAETYATNNGLTFYDASKGMPAPVTCTPPVSEESTDTEPLETTAAPESDVETSISDTEDYVSDEIDSTAADTEENENTGNTDNTDNTGNTGNTEQDGGSFVMIIAIIGAVALVVVVLVVVFVIKAKKSPKK
ncbi:MAG: leucine-rich repeat protein [Clostridia bacterium]|nr:leucine-rich repeat protein [Clostridia bacterium]